LRFITNLVFLVFLFLSPFLIFPLPRGKGEEKKREIIFFLPRGRREKREEKREKRKGEKEKVILPFPEGKGRRKERNNPPSQREKKG